MKKFPIIGLILASGLTAITAIIDKISRRQQKVIKKNTNEIENEEIKNEPVIEEENINILTKEDIDYILTLLEEDILQHYYKVGNKTNFIEDTIKQISYYAEVPQDQINEDTSWYEGNNGNVGDFYDSACVYIFNDFQKDENQQEYNIEVQTELLMSFTNVDKDLNTIEGYAFIPAIKVNKALLPYKVDSIITRYKYNKDTKELIQINKE